MKLATLKAIPLFIAIVTSVFAGHAAGAKTVITHKDSVKARFSRLPQYDLEVLQKELAAYRGDGDSSAVAYSLTVIGKCYNHRSEYVQAIDHYLMAARLQKKLGETDSYVSSLVSLATNCRRIGAYSSASDYLFEALKIIDDLPEKDTKGRLTQRTYILNGLGNIYKYLNDGDEAEKYFRASLEIDRKIGNELGQSMNWNTIGSIYEYRHKYDSAAVMYNRALEHSKKTNSMNSPGICYNRLGQLADIQGDLEEAENYYMMAYDVLTKAQDKWNLAKTTCNLGLLFINKNDFATAKRYLDESESLVAGNKSYGHLQDIHHNLSVLYEKQGQYRKAVEEMKLCLAYSDSSFNQKSGQEVAQTRIRYEKNKSQRLIDEANMEMFREQQARKRTLYISLGALALLLMTVISSILYARFQRKRSRELSKINEIKSKFFSIISHDLKNPILSQKQVLQLLRDNLDTLPPETIKEQCDELYKSSSSLLTLLTGLLSWSRLELGRITVHPIRMNLRSTVEDTLVPIREQATLKNVIINNHIREDVFVMADMNVVATVVRNLVCNAIKFSYEGGEINLNCEQDGNEETLLTVEDNGVGIAKERLDSLSKLKSTIGTQGETGTGLGLTVSKEMVKLAGGRLFVESEEGKGSTFGFTMVTCE